MSGVRLGERLLQIGVDDPTLAGLLAAKVGLSGTAAILAAPGADEARARNTAANAGALVDVYVAAPGPLPFDTAAFDVVVINSAAGRLATLDSHTRAQLLLESHRALRHGGRIFLIEPGPREGFWGLLRPFREHREYEEAGGSLGALETAGFKPVRRLGEGSGYRFAEGLKTSS